jgi:flagellar biosynthesis GTPase FlhF
VDEFSINQVKVSILDHLKWSKSSKEADKKRESFNPNDIPYIFERMYEVGDYLATEEARKEALLEYQETLGQKQAEQPSLMKQFWEMRKQRREEYLKRMTTLLELSIKNQQHGQAGGFA